MFANQILKGLSVHRKNLPFGWDNKYYRNQLNKAVQTIRTSPQFYLGAYSDIEESMLGKLNNKVLFMNGLGDVVLPYPEFIVCYKETCSGKLKIANIVRQYEGDPDIISIETIMCLYNEWILMPFIKIFSLNKHLNETDLYKDGVESVNMDSTPDNTNMAMVILAKGDHATKFLNDPEYIDMQAAFSAIVNYFLLALKYKNVVVETVRKTKSRIIKRKKNRVYNYKVLKIKLPKSYIKYQCDESIRKSKGLIPFSSVMTHEKTYTEDAPLFGKHVGTWIWHNFMRGDKKQGFISKDYSVAMS